MPMNDREYIDVLQLERVRELVPLQDAFAVNKGRPLLWLQRLCCWILRKLGCFAATETTRIERHHIGRNGEKFMTALLKRREAVWGAFEREPKRLLIGAEQYAELTQELCTSGFSFGAEFFIGRGAGQRPKVCGLEIEVIPWMKGILLL